MRVVSAPVDDDVEHLVRYLTRVNNVVAGEVKVLQTWRNEKVETSPFDGSSRLSLTRRDSRMMCRSAISKSVMVYERSPTLGSMGSLHTDINVESV